MAQSKELEPSIPSDRKRELVPKVSQRTGRRQKNFARAQKQFVGRIGVPAFGRLDASTRRATTRYAPERLVDDILDEPSVEPVVRGFILFVIATVASLGGIFLSAILAVFSGFSFLPTLAVYYAVTNAVVLATFVTFALLSSHPHHKEEQ